MNGYLLDTDIVVYLFRGQKGIAERLAALNPDSIYISEVTVAELEYGNCCSSRYEENKSVLEQFLSYVNVVPFSVAIPWYAKERKRLRTIGQNIQDFDLLIGCTSVAKDLIMVTNNESHFSRIAGIQIENWVK
jgi:tRNA(fMet)-specific endonuclease VapC